jgi:hypothetical protein
MVTLIGILFFTLGSSKLEAKNLPWRLNIDTLECESGTLKKEPIKLKNHPQVSDSFLTANQICNNTLTCIDEKDLERLIEKKQIPEGDKAEGFRSSSQADLIARRVYRDKHVCSREFNFWDVRSISDLSDYIFQDPDYPYETKLTYQIYKNTRDNYEAGLQISRIAMDIVESCLRIDVEYSKNYSTPEEKIRAYTDRQNESKQAKLCLFMWKEKNEIKKAKAEWTKIRLLLFMKTLFSSGAVSNESELRTFIFNLSNNNKLTEKQKRVLESPLSFRKVLFSGKISSFWNQTSDKIEKLSHQEVKDLDKAWIQLRDEYPSGDLVGIFGGLTGNVLEKAITDKVSGLPLLRYLESSNPDPAEILKAFEKHRSLSINPKVVENNDINLLKSPALLHQTLFSFPTQELGDACLLSAHLIKTHTDHVEGPLRVLEFAMLAEAGIGAYIAKGLWKKAFALLPKYSVTAYFGAETYNLLDTENSVLAACVNKYRTSKVKCDASQLDEIERQKLLAYATSLLFFPKSTLVVSPFLLESSSDKK